MFKYSIKSLFSKKTISILFSVALCIAISISMVSININSQIDEGFYRADKKYDIIVGPNGSSTQLLMSSLFFSDDPLGTIPTETLEYIKNKYSINKIVPIAIADSYKGNRIVGITANLLEDYEFESGNIFTNDFEIVIGSNIAESYNLSIGDKLVTSHGTSAISEEHNNFPYTVVGILKKTNTSYDNTSFTNIESIWISHEDHDHSTEEYLNNTEYVDNHLHEEDNHSHDDEEDNHDEELHEHEMGYTSLLIKTGNLATANNLETDLNNNSEIQAISTTKILRKLVSNIDISKQVALLLCTIIIILAIILTCVMSFLMLSNSKNDIKLLSFLGVKKIKIYKYIIYQVGTLISLSVLVSLLINKFILIAVNNISSSMGIVLDLNKVYKDEIYITFIYIGLILITSIIYTYIREKKEN